MGVEIYDAQNTAFLGNIVYYKRGTNVEKVVDTAPRSSAHSMDKFLVHALVKVDDASNMRCKATLLIEGIEPYAEKVVEKARPVGRDWFVRAGASGGKGTKEKPFKDPWQALEQCESGDAIHVAEGEYFGKLKTGYWTIDTRYLSMLGGYDKDFTERDPWKHPTRLGFAKDAKAWSQGAYIRFDGDHTGFVVDGFVLDGKDVNKYFENGDLDVGHSAKQGLIELGSPGCTVRNCVLVNGSLGSVSFGGADNAVIENNIMLNFHWHSIQITPGRNEVPYVVRNNTLLFTWYDRADGKGNTSVGTALYTRGDCAFECDNNIIGFNDVQGIFTSSEPKRVKVTNNVFLKDIFAHLQNGKKFRGLMGMPQIATGGKAAEVYCRVYDWKEALKVVPQNPACKAGARPVKVEVKFNSAPPPAAASKTYAPVEFAQLQKDAASLEGKESGFPVNGYFKRDTRVEKTFKKADEKTKYKVRGVARKCNSMAGCLLIESVEKAE